MDSQSVEILDDYSMGLDPNECDTFYDQELQEARDMMIGDDPDDFVSQQVYDEPWAQSFDMVSEALEQSIRASEWSKIVAGDEGDSLFLLDDVVEVDYETRDYQAELFRKSQKKNSIIILETGAGKTIISLLNILDAIKTHGSKKKVAYLANQINLVEQQTTNIRRFLRKMQFMEEYTFLRENQPRVICLHGKRGDDAWRYVFGDINDGIPIILVMTPQYFLNGLRRGYVKIDEFSLVVFDECHHCCNDHPYNVIMKEFYHRSAASVSGFKPQILGLTATPIAAHEKMEHQDIQRRLFQMCMDLDSTFCTLEDVDFGIVSKVQKSEAKIEMWPYKQDSKLDNIDILMEADHRKITSTFKGLEVLFYHWNETMTRIIKSFGKAEARLYYTAQTRMSIEEFFRSKITNRAVALYFELGPYAVYLYFVDIYARMEALLEDFGFTKLGREKIERIKELLAEFLRTIGDYNNENKLSDKLYRLLTLLGDIFSKDPQSTGVIFVERKYIAKVLNKILRVKAPNCIKSEYIIGHNYFGLTPVDEDDKEKQEKKNNMRSDTQNKPQWDEYGEVKKESKNFRKLFNPRLTLRGQLKTINKFKEGGFNLLIATSLVQEGFDVSDCNFVVSFSVPKTALTTVQIRGRARKQNSTYYILVSEAIEWQRKFQVLRNIEIMEKVKIVASQFERYIPTYMTNELGPKGEVLTEMSKDGGCVTVNWSESLTRLFCTSMPANSLEIQKPFYLTLEFKASKTKYMCVVLLPNQSNVRIAAGDLCDNKIDAKRNAALKCIGKLIKLDCFGEYLNPKSLNKDLTELEGLEMDLLSIRFSPQFIKRLDRLYPNSHTFSHFGKRFEMKKQKNGGGRGIYCGYMYDIKLIGSKSCSEKQGMNICLVHSSKLLDGFIFKGAENTTVRLVYRGEIHFTVKEYNNFLLSHRYLVSFANSNLTQFYSSLTDDPPRYYDIQEKKKLDTEYEIWSSHRPSLSFFTVADENFNISEYFLTEIRAYIQYQAKIYMYFNSLSYDQEEQSNSLWEYPSSEFLFKASEDANQLSAGYVLQDIWKFKKYQVKDLHNLSEVDFCSSSDGSNSLQMRAILLGRFLHENSESDYGIEVTEIQKKEHAKIYFDKELMISPIPIYLYNQLTNIIESFKIFPQAEVSVKRFKAILDEQKSEEREVLPCKIDVKDLISAFDYFESQARKQGHLLSQPKLPAQIMKEKEKFEKFSRAESELDEIENKLEEIFVIEKNYEGNIKSIEDTSLELLGAKLIDLLMSCEIFFANPQEWDYSLEKIKKQKIIEWKKGNPLINEILQLFVSRKGNALLCEAMIDNIDKDENKLCSEYLARATFSKIIKNGAYMLYNKENGNFEKVRFFLSKIKLLTHQGISLKIDMSPENRDQSRSVLGELYHAKFRVLEQVIGYTFQYRYLIINAFIEISFRDYYVKWMEKDAPVLESVLETRKKAFENKKEEAVLTNATNATIPEFVVDSINNFHRNPNDLDRFKWLGQSILEFMVLEWIYEIFGEKMTELEITMHAKLFAGDRFIAYLSWAYSLEDYMIGHHNCLEQVKIVKNKIGQKDLLALNLLKNKETEEIQKICTISTGLFYSLICAMFIDCHMNYKLTREKVLALIKPYAIEYMDKDLTEEFAPLKLERICQKKGWKKPEIRKTSLAEKESFIHPASSNYSVYIGEKEYSKTMGTSLKNVEYNLYVLALEELGNC